MTTPRNRTHLAELLGIAKSAVSAQAARGMPTHSLQAAQAWRAANLDPARTKGNRLDENYRPHQPVGDVRTRAIAMMTSAAEALATGKGIEARIPALRQALAAVPPEWRDDLGALPISVMRVLLQPVLDVLPDRSTNPRNDDGSPFYLDGAVMADDEAQAAGVIWYQIAAGELVFDLPALAAYYGTAQSAGGIHDES